MRRLFIYLVVAMVVIGAWRAMRSASRPPHEYGPNHPGRYRGPGPRDDAGRRQRELAVAEARRQAREAVAEARRAVDEARRDVHQAWHEVRDELNRAYRETRDEIRQAYREVVADRYGPTVLPPPPSPPAPPAAPAREVVDGLPVPIVPGTRVTEAEARPPVRARTVSRAAQPATVARPTPADGDVREVPGQICATKDRARDDASRALRFKVAEWLTPQVPASWTPPAGLLESLIIETRIDPYISKDPRTSEVDLEDGPLYIAVLTADFSPGRRAELVHAYNRELVRHRLLTLGGALSFVLICLAAISGYIRADEATKGYYTTRLRLLAAAGVGAAGVMAYRMFA